VVCLQDLHWADPSTIEILRQLATEPLSSTMTLYNYRPEFSFHEGGIREIRLSELSDRDTRELVESLLDASAVPEALVTFLEERTGGNPFFMEEILNSLIENHILTRTDNSWALTGQFDATSVPTTIRGVIAARIDRLDPDRRRILQEASVIGREFMFTILSQVSGGDTTLADGLSALESADLIRQRNVDADLEYLFKHALTQEVAYQGLLRSKRHELHGRVAQAMEQLLDERKREYAESIAYHFQNSDEPERSVPYLLIAGKKAIERYALAEAETYYRSAYDITLGQTASPERDHAMLELLVDRMLVYYYSGDIGLMDALMKEHAGLLDSVQDTELCGMWLTWHCFVAYSVLKLPESLAFADRAIAIGERIGSPRVLAYAYTQRAWADWNMGKGRQVVRDTEAALALLAQLTDERDATYVRLKALCGASLGRTMTGDFIKARALAGELMDFAVASGSKRALCFAHLSAAFIANGSGDEAREIAEGQKARDAAADPFYKAIAESFLAGWLIGTDTEAGKAMIDELLAYTEPRGLTGVGIGSKPNLAQILIMEGEISRGMQELEAAKREAYDLEFVMAPACEMMEAIIYARIATGEGGGGRPSVGMLVKNAGFVLGKARKASDIGREKLAKLSAELSPDIEVLRFRIEFEFAKLLIKRKERDEARRHLEKAIAFLQPIGDCVGMRDAKALLATLDAK
jgi:hypothetical protein